MRCECEAHNPTTLVYLIPTSVTSIHHEWKTIIGKKIMTNAICKKIPHLSHPNFPHPMRDTPFGCRKCESNIAPNFPIFSLFPSPPWIAGRQLCSHARDTANAQCAWGPYNPHSARNGHVGSHPAADSLNMHAIGEICIYEDIVFYTKLLHDTINFTQTFLCPHLNVRICQCTSNKILWWISSDVYYASTTSECLNHCIIFHTD
jgi:hypothetical protein